MFYNLKLKYVTIVHNDDRNSNIMNIMWNYPYMEFPGAYVMIFMVLWKHVISGS